MKKHVCNLFVVVTLLFVANCTDATDTGIIDTGDVDVSVPADSGAEVESDPELNIGSDSSIDLTSGGDIETWLVEVGNDFPDSATCVAAAMRGYAVSDFEKSFAGELNEPFETELDTAYEVCDAALGITSEP